MTSLSILSALLLSANARRTDYPEAVLKNQIKSLPGLDDATFAKYTMFSGYITVDQAHNRSLFYWFVESLNDPATDPVALWTNGGPGCSGLAGMFTELGPFRPTKDLTLYVNNFSWVNAANVLFIEAPAGVGFSFSDVTSDYATDDNQTAIDNYALIKGWLKEYSNYQKADFFLTSESYGGHYLPTLAQQIVLGNQAGGTPKVNLKGFFVGNPYTDPAENARGMFDTWYGHQLVSYPAWTTWYTACKDGEAMDNAACDKATDALNAEVGDNIDPYALDFPVCLSQSGHGALGAASLTERVWFMKTVVQDALGRPVPGIYADLVAKLELEVERRRLGETDFPPSDYFACETNWATQWLNEPAVQTAIYAKPTKWAECSDAVNLNYSAASLANPMEPTWKWLVQSGGGLRMTIVSGDDDSVCGSLGTQSWLWQMGYEVENKANWVAWMDSTDQVGGYVTKFENALNFVTVHSAGHMIPETQPRRSLETFAAYLHGEI